MSSLIYKSGHRIKFTEISERYKVPKSFKGKLSELHALLITYVVQHFSNTKKFKQLTVDCLNLITYAVFADEPLPFNWSPNSPFDNIPECDKDRIRDTLGDLYLTIDSIDWDLEEVDSPDAINAEIEKDAPASSSGLTVSIDKEIKKPSAAVEWVEPTPKQDLYIRPPEFPQFDYRKVWLSQVCGPDKLVIYQTLPEIPTKQNEISCTTDVSRMQYGELMRLYPNHLIHTRSPIMYQSCNGIKLDSELGLILPIEGYTEEQVIDNIIRYPHLFKLSRCIDGQFSSFYANIEIDGQLRDTLEIWDSLPESSVIPKQAEFVKEYVVRRYLLERDIKKVKHNYPLFGTLEPFLTLFMTPAQYINRGYIDVEQLAKDCVQSRVSYKQSRNPVIRRVKENAELHV